MDGEAQVPGVEFFISELEQMSNSFERRFNAQSKRIEELESKVKGQYNDDPMTSLVPFIIVVVALQFLPLLGDMVASWRQRSQSLES